MIASYLYKVLTMVGTPATAGVVGKKFTYPDQSKISQVSTKSRENCPYPTFQERQKTDEIISFIIWSQSFKM